MRSANRRYLVPKDTATRGGARIADDTSNIFDTLAIEMNFHFWLLGKALKLFDDAAFGTVLTIQKRRYNGESQFSETMDRGVAATGHWTVTMQTAPTLASERVPQARAKDRRSL